MRVLYFNFLVQEADSCPFKNSDYAVKSEQKRKRWKNSKQITDTLKDPSVPQPNCNLYSINHILI